MMIRTMICAATALVISSAAFAEPLTLTDSQMDKVTAGFTVNGKLIATVGGENGGGTIVAGGQSQALPSQVQGAPGANGPWRIGQAADQAKVGQGGPIDHP